MATTQIVKNGVVKDIHDHRLPSTIGTDGQVLTANNGSVIWDDPAPGGVWGLITGTLSDQTDLNQALTNRELVANKVTTITSSSTDTEYPTAKLLYDTRQDLKEIAEGKTNSYVVSKVTNPAFDTQDALIQMAGTFTDINSKVHNISDLKLGDNIYVIETDVPDRWCSDPQEITPIVPEGYTLLLYLDFTVAGGYYLTNIAPTNHTILLKVDDYNYINDKHYYGIVGGSGNHCHFTTYANKYYWGGLNGAGESSSGSYSWIRGIHEITVNAIDNHKVIVDGTVVGLGTNITCSSNQYILIGIRQSTANFTGKYYYFKIIDRDTGDEVFNGVPAKRNSDDAYGFWDTVSSSFITKTGSGTITGVTEGVTLYKLETAKVPVQDVQVNGTTIVANSIANLTGTNLPSHTLSKISDVTATASEINYSSGVTSNIQTLINAKQPIVNIRTVVADV